MVLGDLPCIGFGVAFAGREQFLDVGLAAGEEVTRSEFGIGRRRGTLVVIGVTEIHASLAFAFAVGTGHEDHAFTVFGFGRAGNLSYTGHKCYFHCF